jgi:hypothetical protein
VQIKVVLRADVERGAYDKVAVISGNFPRFELCFVLIALAYDGLFLSYVEHMKCHGIALFRVSDMV